VLVEHGKLDEAEPLAREALEASRQMRGERHVRTLDSMETLARLLNEKGKLKEAEPLYRDVLEGRREVLGPRHPETLAP
jgi:hypothetical protein